MLVKGLVFIVPRTLPGHTAHGEHSAGVSHVSCPSSQGRRRTRAKDGARGRGVGAARGGGVGPRGAAMAGRARGRGARAQAPICECLPCVCRRGASSAPGPPRAGLARCRQHPAAAPGLQHLRQGLGALCTPGLPPSPRSALPLGSILLTNFATWLGSRGWPRRRSGALTET
jgi:hypothetical protein